MATSKAGRSSRLRPSTFVPTVGEISSAADLERIRGLAGVISYWTRNDSPGDWIRSVSESHGSVGTYLRRGEDVLGFLLHCPGGYMPRLEEYPVGNLDPATQTLAYLEGDVRTCKRLLVRMLRNLKGAGVGRVEAVASDFGAARHVPTSFLLDVGWNPVASGWKHGGLYTRLGLDLGSTVENGEFARGLLEKVRFPDIRQIGPIRGIQPSPVPTMPGSFNRAGTDVTRTGERGPSSD